MTKLVVGLFLMAHGLVQISIWAGPEPKGAGPPFDASHSWLLERAGANATTANTIGVILALVTGLGFVLAGIGLFVGLDMWRVIAIGAAAMSLPLMIAYFDPWLLGGIAIEASILYVLAFTQWPSETLVGA